MPAKRACHAKNKAGEPCKATPLRDSDYCAAHDPKTPESARFGSPEQASSAGGGRPRNPRVIDVLRERVEEHVDEILAPYFDALQNAVLHTAFQGEVFVSPHPDVAARIAAAERLLDRAYGRPMQQTELTGRAGGPLETNVNLRALTGEQLAQLEEILRAARDD